MTEKMIIRSDFEFARDSLERLNSFLPAVDMLLNNYTEDSKPYSLFGPRNDPLSVSLEELFKEGKWCIYDLNRVLTKYCLVEEFATLEEYVDYLENTLEKNFKSPLEIKLKKVEDILKGLDEEEDDARLICRNRIISDSKDLLGTIDDALNWAKNIKQSGLSKGNITDRSVKAKHGKGFRSVKWFGTEYSFTPIQAAAVKILWEAWENETPDIGGETLLEEIGSESTRANDIFKRHPAFGKMICKGKTKGSFRLVEPDK